MTAEIGILNRQGVALAADSAVTIGLGGKQKVLNSANKLFNLIKGYPVGVMVYGGGDFLGLPWDVIIDDYRKKYTYKNELEKIVDYATDFFEKLADKKYFSKESYKGYSYRNLYRIIVDIVEDIKKELSEKYPNREITIEEAMVCFDLHLQSKTDELELLDYSKGFDEDDIKKIVEDENNRDIVKICLKEHVFFQITEEVLHKVNKINALIQCKDIYMNYSGIVFSGYGFSELFPSLLEFHVEGIINGKLKYKLVRGTKISAEDYGENKIADIVPFAQQEMVHSVLNGIDPNVYEMLNNNLDAFINVLGDEAKAIFNCIECKINEQQINKLKDVTTTQLSTMMKFIDRKCKEFYKDPILDMVSLLPKDELATMAETLVNLTSFKRKITIDAETVGGPIDVAIISKAEGFIWMKRKLYFSKELNLNYNLRSDWQ